MFDGCTLVSNAYGAYIGASRHCRLIENLRPYIIILNEFMRSIDIADKSVHD